MVVEAPQIIKDLVQRFDDNKHIYTNSSYDEENTKIEFINPFFEALGWDVTNKIGASARYKEVVFEDTIKINGKAKAPDYSFRLGGQRIFFVEAKKPSVNIETDKNPAFQVRRYGWSAKLPLCILTDFEELAVYETNIKPDKRQNASIGRVKYYTYKDYVEKWDEIYNIFSKESVINGNFDNFVTGHKGIKKGTSEVDNEFLKEIDNWRIILARNIALRNKDLSIEELNHAVQLTIDRIIFLKMAEDRGIEKYGQLQKMLEVSNNDKDDYPVYREFIELCKKADAKYNSGLFHFTEEKDINLDADYLTPNLKIDDGVFKEIFKNMYYPDCPYEFSMISTEILGSIYEKFLGKKIRLTNSHQAKIEEKPEVKKAGGVFYTPQYIVDYIVENTIGGLIKGKTPNQVSKMRFVDPACGSGTFLLGAFQYLIDWHLDYYSSMERPPKDVIYTGRDGITRLTINEKKRIVVNNIYGVDIDAQAVEVSKLSLLLKVLEDSNKDVLEAQQKLFQERALPYLGDNIRCGNSLIISDILENEDLIIDEIVKINPFDWEETFKEVFENGGFDAVIGNPPYVFGGNKGINNLEKQFFKNNFISGTGKINLFTLFMEKSVSILKNKGLMSFIIPNTLLRVTSYKNIRQFLANNTKINEIVDLSAGVFKGATTSSIIFSLSNINSNLENNVIIKKDLSNNVFNSIKQKDFTGQGFIYNIFCKPKERLIINKLCENSINLGKLSKYIRFGVVISKNQDEIVGLDKIDETYKPFIEGKEINRYLISYKSRYLHYIPKLIHRPRTPDLFESEKIMIQRITGGNKPIKATYDDGYFYNKESIINIILNCSDYDYKYILSLLNSNLINWYYNKEFSNESKLTVNLSKEYLSAIPIKKVELENQKTFIELVDKMLDLNKKLAICKTPNEKRLLEKQIEITDKKINQTVYELYDLTNEEISIIEDSLK